MVEYTPMDPKAAGPVREVPWRTDRKEWWMRVIFWLVVIAGVAVWIRFFSAYSFTNTYLDEAFGPLVGMLAVLGFLFLRGTGSTYARSPRWVAMLPALIGGGVQLLLFVVMWVPPFTLGAMFYWDEVLGEQVIQSEVSPDGERTATVYWRGVGAYDGGNGRTVVEITRRGIPLIGREVYWKHQSYADEDTHRYVRWEDERTIVVIGEPDVEPVTVNLGWRPL